jgi:hypothetical protein
MLMFDQSLGWLALEERQARTASARQRLLLQTVIDHVKAEVGLSVDGLMDTLVAEPRYRFWVGGRDVGPKGYDEVRAYYENFVADGGAILESVKERIVVDDDTISHEGEIRNLVSGTIAKRRGYSVPDESGHYLVRFRNVVWWSFDDAGKALGEDSYSALDLEAWEHVADDELPSCYLRYLEMIGARDHALRR